VLTDVNISFITVNMESIEIDYSHLTGAALIKIFELSDLLGCRPKSAAAIYLSYVAQDSLTLDPQPEQAER